MRRAPHPVIAGLASADAGDRRDACRTAVDDPSAIVLLEALAAALADSDPSVQRAASDALAALAHSVEGVEAVLRASLRGDDHQGRWGAAWTLARVAPPDPVTLPALVEAMGSPASDVRWQATRLLVEAGRLLPEVLPLVLGLAQSGEDSVVQRMAIFALRELAPDEPAAADAIVATSHSADLPLRRAAITALAALLAPPDFVVERLIELTRADPDAPSRRLAALALGAIGSGRHGPLGADARAALHDAAHDSEDPDLRRCAERALNRIQA